jgi:hypothetical protein
MMGNGVGEEGEEDVTASSKPRSCDGGFHSITLWPSFSIVLVIISSALRTGGCSWTIPSQCKIPNAS